MQVDLATIVLVLLSGHYSLKAPEMGVLRGQAEKKGQAEDDTRYSRTLHTDYRWSITNNYY